MVHEASSVTALAEVGETSGARSYLEVSEVLEDDWNMT